MRKKMGKKGFTIPMAMILLFLLFAFAMGVLMFASYNYNNAYKRHEKMQTYLYAKNLLDECEYAIMDGRLNPLLVELVDSVGQREGKVYAKKYNMKLGLADTDHLVNEFNQDQVDMELNITYKPNASGKGLPPEKADYLAVGDQMEIEFRISKIGVVRKEPMEYRINSEFYCYYDDRLNEDGTLKANYDKWPDDDPLSPGMSKTSDEQKWNMKWKPFQYTGNIYTR